MLNLLVALRTLGDQWVSSRIVDHCDNLAVVFTVQTGKIKDPFLAACLRNVWLVTASRDIKIEIKHVIGKKNIVADLLCGMFSPNKVDMKLLNHLRHTCHWEKIPIAYLSIASFI